MGLIQTAALMEKALTSLVRYHEAHITLEVKDRDVAETVGRLHAFKWSQIDGDEEMGPGVHGYLTRSSGYKTLLAAALFDLCDDLEAHGVKWKRRKIEAVAFDERNPK